jgi:deoxyribodipyrimidine photolyase-related protein
MWTNTPFGWHSLLSVALNLHLLHPREVIDAVETAHQTQNLDLAGVEGFIRQILGWREFIRGVYWLYPGLKTDNHFDHQRPLPPWFWTGKTQMACLRDCIGQTLEHGYAHHIQRLMVTGLFALLAESKPQAVADWYLAVYVDAIEWVELPNVAGMSLYANGGKFTSKPYVASGAYIKRQSNHCQGCQYKPDVKTGPNACPFTTLYWHFLMKHEAELANNARTALMVRNLARMGEAERQGIRLHAEALLNQLDAL